MKCNPYPVRLILLLFLMVGALISRAQISTEELPYGLNHNISSTSIATQIIPIDKSDVDEQMLQQEFPSMAGVSLMADILFSQYATSTRISDSLTLWQLKVTVPDARYLGIVFSDFTIAPGDKMFIYDESGEYHIGAFTSDNNNESGVFSTHILPASALIVEYLSTDPEYIPTFVIDEMIYAWSDFVLDDTRLQDKSSGTCNVNINCEEGFNWQKQKRGVVRIMLRSGTSWFNCTGTLINNTSDDKLNYFLTSDHCGSSATAEDLLVWQFYFGYEYPGCDNSGSAPQNRMISGAELKAKSPLKSGTDFKLLLLTQTPPNSWRPYYNGWSRSSFNPPSGIGIHHPSGDAKKISTFTKTLSSATFTGGMALAYWRVEWSATDSGHGITEGGSSGSPLFDENGLIVGTLSGGSSGCTSPTLPDYYGKFYMHWRANGDSPDKSLYTWLDPINANPEFLYGYDPVAATNFVIAHPSPTTGGKVDGSGYYAAGEIVKLTATPLDKYIFFHWKNQDDVIVSTAANYNFVMPADEVVLTAVFSPEQSTSLPGQMPLQVMVSPNPASMAVNLQFINSSGEARVSIHSLSGQQVSHFLLPDTHQLTKQTISVAELPQGMYILTIDTGAGILNKKLFIR